MPISIIKSASNKVCRFVWYKAKADGRKNWRFERHGGKHFSVNATATHIDEASLGRILERCLLPWLLLLGFLAFAWPQLNLSVDPFLYSQEYLNYFIAVTMFFVGWLLPRDEVQQVARRWPKVLGGSCVQYVSMPLLALFWANAFGLANQWLWGVILVGCVPGAMASNVLTLAARGNVSYSLSLTTLATVLSPLFVPLMLGLLLEKESTASDFADTSLQLCWMVVLPVFAGHSLTRLFPDWQWVGIRIGPVVANLTILWIIAVVVAANRETLWPDKTSVQSPLALVFALLAINLSGYVAGRIGSWLLRLDRPMQRALTLEVGMQNAGLGTVLAMKTLFPGQADVAIPPAMYTFGCMVTGTMLARFWVRLDERRGDETP